MRADGRVRVAELTAPADEMRRRVASAGIAVTGVVLLAGAVAGVRDPHWALLAAAVVFGWSQLSGA